MASLYIKDQEANTLAEQLAAARGITKTAAVKLALRHELERDAGSPPARRPMREVIEEMWREHGWTAPTGPEADKAFFDSLYEG